MPANFRASLQDHLPPSSPNASESRPEIKSRESEITTIAQDKISSATVPKWDFKLPSIVLAASEPELSIDEGWTQEFSIARIVHALQGGLKHEKLQQYLSFFSESVIARYANAVVAGYPAIFYAVATNDERIIREVRMTKFLNCFPSPSRTVLLLLHIPFRLTPDLLVDILRWECQRYG